MEGIAPQMLRMVSMIAVVGIFVYAVTLDDPTAPQFVGWDAFITRVTTPLSGFTAFQGNWANQHDCPGWDIGCGVGNLGNFIAGIGINLVAVGTWFFALALDISVGLFGILTLTFNPPLPTIVQVLLWVFVAPFWFMVAMWFISTVRGN